MRDGRIAFVLARDIGDAFVARDVDLGAVRRAARRGARRAAGARLSATRDVSGRGLQSNCPRVDASTDCVNQPGPIGCRVEAVGSERQCATRRMITAPHAALACRCRGRRRRRCAALGVAVAAGAGRAVGPAPAPRRRRRRTARRRRRARRRDPDLVMTLRAGVAVSPAYFGSDDYEVGPDVAARFDYVRFPGGFEYGSARTVGFRTGFGLRGSVRYIGERDSDDYDEIAGLDDVDWSFEAGLGVGYEQRNWRAFADVRYGIDRPQRLGRRDRRRRHRLSDRRPDADARSAARLRRRPLRGHLLRRLGRANPPPPAWSGSTPTAACSAPGSSSARATSSTSAGASRAPPTWQRLLNDAAEFADHRRPAREDQYSVRLGITRRISLDF